MCGIWTQNWIWNAGAINMGTCRELVGYIKGCGGILRQISKYGNKLYFEPWIYNSVYHIKISDEFKLKTPDVSFVVVKYKHLGKTPYRFNLCSETKIMEYPQNPTLFNILFAPIIFHACARKYKGKHK